MAIKALQKSLGDSATSDRLYRTSQPWAQPSDGKPDEQGPCHWTAIIPFHNERAHLPATLASLAAQTMPVRVVLVDNGSTDESGALALSLSRKLGLKATLLNERRPGKVAALQAGMQRVRTRYVATCDADTVYPKRYLEIATSVLSRPMRAAAIAAYTAADAPPWIARLAGLRLRLTARMLTQQCLNGGAGQVFVTEALRRAGGFDPDIWNWVLEDHEVMARIEHVGRLDYDSRLVCHPASRPREADCTGWTFAERILYHLSGPRSRVSFFHKFLAPRLAERALTSDSLRRSDKGVPA